MNALRLLTLTALMLCGFARAGGTIDSREESWVELASAGFDARVLDTLRQIAPPDRRLLALRAYLRAGDSLAARWSWSQQQLSDYPTTPEGKAASEQIDAVIAAFAAANPGFTLRVNREPRSLELQLTRWNENESVGKAAAELAASLNHQFLGAKKAVTADVLCKFLIEWQPSVRAALAAPGLSAHGQARAFDFAVERGGEIIAGPEFASAGERWDAAGWTEKLRAAVRAAGDRFAGPLAAPYEPWHYTYAPQATTLDRVAR